jgi:hypothetical protein
MEEQSSRLQSSEHRHRRQYRPRDTSVAPFDWQTYFPNVEYDFTDRRCELTSALIDAFCGVENGERLFDEVRRAFCCLRLFLFGFLSVRFWFLLFVLATRLTFF